MITRNKMLGVVFIFALANFGSGLIEAAVLAAVGTAVSSVVAYLVKLITERKERKRKPPGRK